MDKQKENTIERSPVVVIMGHIDHGKSTLLDYIRKSNIVDKEAGGITQHIAAYEVTHKNEKGVDKKITFLDTPGHEAYSAMRERGAKVADIAILMVSAEDGVKPQTVEAWKTIVNSNTPCIVAINKIDKPGANIEKTKTELAENEIYLEGYGGKTPVTMISAKDGTGIDELLSLINILAELEDFKGDKSLKASGFVIEANVDPRRGIEATLIIKDGTMKKGMTVVSEDSICSTRMIENFLGKVVAEASFSSPVRLVGFDKIPNVGAEFKTFEKKSDAQKYAAEFMLKISNSDATNSVEDIEENTKIISIVLKADVSGSVEAIEKEINKIKGENIEFKILQSGAGPITEKDIKAIAGGENSLVIGFNTKADKSASELAEKRGIPIMFFDIIYKLTEWLTEEMEKRRPRIDTVETSGKAKILRAFSRTKERQILGGKVLEGKIGLNSNIKIIRREFEIGKGKIVNLEKGKTKTSIVEEGSEFGMMIESKIELATGDTIESFSIVKK